MLVASSPEVLARGEGDLWDSGRVASDQSVLVAYQGKPLAAMQQVWWKVRAWPAKPADGQPSAWSEPATWTMGLPQAAGLAGEMDHVRYEPFGVPPSGGKD